MGQDPKQDPNEGEDWLGFDKLARRLGESTEEDTPKPEAPADPAPEEPVEPEIPSQDEGAAPKD